MRATAKLRFCGSLSYRKAWIWIMEDMLRVGVISSTHGLKGEVKVFPTTDDVSRFSSLKKVYIEINPMNKTGKAGTEVKEFEIQSVKYFKQFAIVKFKGINNIDDVEKYKGKDLLIRREDAVPLEEHEYFITDLIGLKVIEEENGTEIGTLEDVIQTGANDVYQIKTLPGYANNQELLIPAIEQCIREVDMENRVIKVHIMKGLLDL